MAAVLGGLGAGFDGGAGSYCIFALVCRFCTIVRLKKREKINKRDESIPACPVRPDCVPTSVGSGEPVLRRGFGVKARVTGSQAKSSYCMRCKVSRS